MYFVDRTAVVLKPTQRFLDWLKSTDDNLPELTLEQIRSNCSVFLVPEFDTPEAVVAYFDERYRQIFEAEISAWEVGKKDWPQDMGLQAFGNFSMSKSTIPCSTLTTKTSKSSQWWTT